ncbi:uncharacterized protein LOC133763317 [Lepus europaeus]|uniref:uncharacterized protein LOC133763317 n=1 Tax=Lepus europaeus TaxID=9983 RepID=UPI002B4743B3|nr:uncharacterized protein LOC133763317 [Lepus europaeus]
MKLQPLLISRAWMKSPGVLLHPLCMYLNPGFSVLLTPGRRRQRSPPPRIRGWGKPDFGSGPGQTRNFGVGFARLSRRPPRPGFETSTCFRSPARLLLTALQVAHGPKEESGFGTGLSGVPRPSLVAERLCLSGWPNPPGVAKGPTWRSGKLRGDPQATKTEWAPPGRANLNPFLVPPGLLPMLKTLPPPVSHPGAPRLATGQVAAPRKQATRRRRKRTSPARTETESTAWLEKASGTHPERLRSSVLISGILASCSRRTNRREKNK